MVERVLKPASRGKISEDSFGGLLVAGRRRLIEFRGMPANLEGWRAMRMRARVREDAQVLLNLFLRFSSLYFLAEVVGTRPTLGSLSV